MELGAGKEDTATTPVTPPLVLVVLVALDPDPAGPPVGGNDSARGWSAAPPSREYCASAACAAAAVGCGAAAAAVAAAAADAIGPAADEDAVPELVGDNRMTLPPTVPPLPVCDADAFDVEGEEEGMTPAPLPGRVLAAADKEAGNKIVAVVVSASLPEGKKKGKAGVWEGGGGGGCSSPAGDGSG